MSILPTFCKFTIIESVKLEQSGFDMRGKYTETYRMVRAILHVSMDINFIPKSMINLAPFS